VPGRPAARLVEQRRPPEPVMMNDGLRISRHVGHRRTWPALGDLVGKPPSVHAFRRDHVGEQQVACYTLVDERQRFRTIGGREDGISAGFFVHEPGERRGVPRSGGIGPPNGGGSRTRAVPRRDRRNASAGNRFEIGAARPMATATANCARMTLSIRPAACAGANRTRYCSLAAHEVRVGSGLRTFADSDLDGQKHNR